MCRYRIINGHNLSYAYDDLYRLTVASSTNAVNNQNFRQTYSYNAIGNIMNKSDIGNYVYGNTNYANPHAATQINGVNYSYDNNGNLTNDGTWQHNWTYDNRLASSTNGLINVTYSYDHTGQRVKMTNGTDSYIYPNKYFNINNATTTKQIFANDRLIATIEGNGTATSTYYTHSDHLGGSSVITDNTGTLTQTLDYYPYGGIRLDERSGKIDEKRKAFGHEYDSDSELYYMVARYQNPGIGRFISQDPLTNDIGIDYDLFREKYGKESIEVLSNPQELNSYSYVTNNPLRFVDPFGFSGQITIYSNAGGGNSSQNMISGHSWITYTPDSSNKTTSYGAWGNNPNGRGNGLLENEESNRGMTTADVTRTSHIDDAHEKALLSTIQEYKDKGAAGWMLMAPCSAFAQDAWDAGTGEYLNANTSIVNNPQTLKNSIINANGGNNHGTLNTATNNSFLSNLSNSLKHFSNSIERVKGNTRRGVGKAFNPAAQRLYILLNR